MRSATTGSRNTQNYAHRNNHSLQNTEEEHITFATETTAAAPAAHAHEVPFIAGCSHFTRKNARFCAPASSLAQAPCNIHSAITMHFAASRRKPARIYTWQHQMTTIMQPFQCDLQPQIQETQRTTHTGTTTRCRTQSRNPLRSERPQPHPPHTGGTFHRRLQPLYTKKCKVSCSGFLLSTSPMQHSFSHYHAFCSISSQTCTHLHVATPDDNNHAAIPMQSATTDSRKQRTTHTGTTTRCRTQEKPITLGTTPAAPAAHRRYLSSPPAATLHGKMQGFVLRLPP